MIIERFKESAGGLAAVSERFTRRGRMIPEGSGVAYVASWMAADGASCFQIMESPDRAALEPWARNWEDLVEFEVVEIVASADFWRAWHAAAHR